MSDPTQCKIREECDRSIYEDIEGIEFLAKRCQLSLSNGTLNPSSFKKVADKIRSELRIIKIALERKNK